MVVDVVVVLVVEVDDELVVVVVDVVELVVAVEEELEVTAGALLAEVALIAVGVTMVVFVFATVVKLTASWSATAGILSLLTCGNGDSGVDAAVVTLLDWCASLTFNTFSTFGAEVDVIPFISTPFLAKIRPRFECS